MSRQRFRTKLSRLKATKGKDGQGAPVSVAVEIVGSASEPNLWIQIIQNIISGSESCVVMDEGVIQGVDRTPESWIFYFKLSATAESKCLLAHPAEGEWVATVSLDRELWEEILKKIEAPELLFISELRRLSSFSNLHLSFNPQG